MNVSPLDLRQQRFHSRFRGFDKIEVTSFLTAVADDYEQALRETDHLRQELATMAAVLKEHREREQNLRATLTTAQRVSDDIKTTAQRLSDDIKSAAEKEAERIIREADSRSQLLLDKTQGRLEDIERAIDGLKLKRRDVETSIEATIQTLRNSLDYVREQETREREERILLHRPRHGDQTADAHASHEAAPRSARL
jgi:cell division initiation protein